MKEVLGSLPEVITAYKNYNLLVPTATDENSFEIRLSLFSETANELPSVPVHCFQ